MSKYIPFTTEQKERAASVDLEEFLRRRGEKLITSGRDKRLASDHSITIRGCEWFDHATEQGGRASASSSSSMDSATRTPCLCSSAMISAEATLRQGRRSRSLQSPSRSQRRVSPCAVCMHTCCKSVASTVRYSMPSCARSSSTKAVKNPGMGQRNTTTRVRRIR